MSENQPMDSRQHDTDQMSDRRPDDRRETVKPEENPVPRSPEPDEEAMRKGEEILGRIKPY